MTRLTTIPGRTGHGTRFLLGLAVAAGLALLSLAATTWAQAETQGGAAAPQFVPPALAAPAPAAVPPVGTAAPAAGTSAQALDNVLKAAQKQMADFQAQMEQMKSRMEQTLRDTETALEASRAQTRALEQELATLKAQTARDIGTAAAAVETGAPATATTATATATTVPAAQGDVYQWAPDVKPQEPPSLVDGTKIQVPGDTDAAAAAGAEQTLQFFGTMVSGDKDIVEELDAWKKWSDRVTFNVVTLREINEFRLKLTQALQQEGYVFAKVRFPPQVWAHGIFLAQVDCGPLGGVTVTGNRHYSSKQILRAISHRDTDRFDYAQIHRDLFDLSSRPDLKVDTKLKTVVRDGRTVVDAELAVQDKLPIHGSLELSNTASKNESGDWRLRGTLQHLNLTKHDDILTLGYLTNPQEPHEVSAYSGSYSVPFGDWYNFGMFGGYSESDMDEVAPELDVFGRGYFFGLSLGRVLYRTKQYDIDATLGWTFQEVESSTDLAALEYEQSEINLSMFRFSLGYADREFDRYLGRNFASFAMIFNSSGRFGSSDQGPFTENRVDADATFTVEKLQLARFQKLSPRPSTVLGRSSLFLRLDGQYTNDNLISAVQMPMGGMNSVRGYEESESQADIGAVGTAELRFPLWTNFVPGLTRTPEEVAEGIDDWMYHGLQFVLFVDVGHLEHNGLLFGEKENEDFSSGGFGFRWALTDYSQMKLDFGFPFNTTEESRSSGRAHLSLKLQF